MQGPMTDPKPISQWPASQPTSLHTPGYLTNIRNLHFLTRCGVQTVALWQWHMRQHKPSQARLFRQRSMATACSATECGEYLHHGKREGLFACMAKHSLSASNSMSQWIIAYYSGLMLASLLLTPPCLVLVPVG